MALMEMDEDVEAIAEYNKTGKGKNRNENEIENLAQKHSWKNKRD